LTEARCHRLRQPVPPPGHGYFLFLHVPQHLFFKRLKLISGGVFVAFLGTKNQWLIIVSPSSRCNRRRRAPLFFCARRQCRNPSIPTLSRNGLSKAGMGRILQPRGEFPTQPYPPRRIYRISRSREIWRIQFP